MKLFEVVQQRRQEARTVTKNVVATNLLTTLYGELTTEQKKLKVGEGLADEVVIAKIKKFLKSNFEFQNIQKEAGVAVDPVLLEEQEILESFIPKSLTPDELKYIINLNGLSGVPNIMQFFKKHFAGQYDGKVLSNIAKGV